MTTTPTASPELPDLDQLEALARAATPGEWKALPHGRVVGGPLRHYVNGSAKAQIASFGVTFHEQAPEDEPERQQANADFAAAANPEQVLALIALARRAQPYATGGIVPGGLHLAGEASQAACTVPPDGWHCTRAPGHDGPCAAWPIAQRAAAPGTLEKSARALAEKWHKDAVDTGFATSEAAVELLEVLDAAPSAPGTPEAPQTAAARDVLAERQRQVEQEGWTPAHDDAYVDGQLASAAVAYAQAYTPYLVPSSWPWAVEWFKAGDDRRNMVKAGALILAEIERLDRAAQLDGGQEGSAS